MSTFDYEASAEIYSGVSRGTRTGPLAYRRFNRSADAIRFTIEELSDQAQRGTAMEIDGERFKFAQIRDLYVRAEYPLLRRSVAKGI
jgi:hypothetical protein